MSGGDYEGKLSRAGRTADEVRHELRQSDECSQLAEMVGLEVEEYIEMVVSYAMDPEKEPVLKIIPEDVAEAQGISIPTMAQVTQWLKDIISGKIVERAEDELSKASGECAAVAITGGRNPRAAAPTVADLQRSSNEGGSSSVLKNELQSRAVNAHLGAPKGPRNKAS